MAERTCFSQVLKAMGMTNCDLRPDVTGDCKVDTQDLLLVLGAVDQVSVRWRTTTSASLQPVPLTSCQRYGVE